MCGPPRNKSRMLDLIDAMGDDPQGDPEELVQHFKAIEAVLRKTAARARLRVRKLFEQDPASTERGPWTQPWSVWS